MGGGRPPILLQTGVLTLTLSVEIYFASLTHLRRTSNAPATHLCRTCDALRQRKATLQKRVQKL